MWITLWKGCDFMNWEEVKTHADYNKFKEGLKIEAIMLANQIIRKRKGSFTLQEIYQEVKPQVMANVPRQCHYSFTQEQMLAILKRQIQENHIETFFVEEYEFEEVPYITYREEKVYRKITKQIKKYKLK